MKAVKYVKYGSPEVVKVVELLKPSPGENQVLIKIHTSTVSPAECALRRADPFITRLFGGLFAPKLTPGDMFAGEIIEVSSQVNTLRAGDRVYGASGSSMGAHAQYMVLDINQAIVKIPESISYEDAASLSDGGITALPFLRDNGQINNNHHILINGASGSVGTYAVQLAKYYGATVTAVCSGKNIDLVKSLGADYAIDYTKDDFTTKNEEYDIIFDAVGKSTFRKCKKALKENGTYLSTVPSFSLMLKSTFSKKKTGQKAIFAATGLRKPQDKKPDFELLRDLTIQDKLKTVIDRVYPLKDIAEAHEYVETGHKVGNVVINFQK